MGVQGWFLVLIGAVRRQGCGVGSAGPPKQRLDLGDRVCWGQESPPPVLGDVGKDEDPETTAGSDSTGAALAKMVGRVELERQREGGSRGAALSQRWSARDTVLRGTYAGGHRPQRGRGGWQEESRQVRRPLAEAGGEAAWGARQAELVSGAGAGPSQRGGGLSCRLGAPVGVTVRDLK